MASRPLLNLFRPSICSQCSRSLQRHAALPIRSFTTSKSRSKPDVEQSITESPSPSDPSILLRATRRRLYLQKHNIDRDHDAESHLQHDLKVLGHSQQYNPQRAPSTPPLVPDTPVELSPSIKSHLTALAAQTPHYAVIHIHGRPYLVTKGDSVRLPFLMHGVSPGDVLRLTRASILGSREWTLKGGLPASRPGSRIAADDELAIVPPVIGRTQPEDLQPQMEHTSPPSDSANADAVDTNTTATAHSFFKRKSGPMYLDERFFVCRATVLGHESEPMRVKNKKKPRIRRTRRAFSKLRYTIIRIGELQVKTLEDLEAGIATEASSS